MRIRIGDLLVKAGRDHHLQLKAALAEQSQWGGKLADILVRMEFITEEVLVAALSEADRHRPRRPSPARRPDRREARPPRERPEEFNLVPLALKDEGRTPGVADERPRQRDGHRHCAR